VDITRLRELKIKQTKQFIIAFFIMLVIEEAVALSVMATNEYVANGCNLQKYKLDQVMPLTITVAVFIIIYTCIMIYGVYVMRKVGVRDEFNISNEIRLVVAAFIICLICYFVAIVLGTKSHYFSGVVADSIVYIMVITVHTINVSWPIYRTYVAPQDIQFTNIKDFDFQMSNLKNLLENEFFVKNFKEYLVTEFSVENLLFYLEVQNYIRVIKDNTESNIMEYALFIYNTFIDYKGSMPVNLSYDTIKKIQQSVNNPQLSHYESLTLFQASQYEIYTLMQKDSFLRFKKKVLFLKIFWLP